VQDLCKEICKNMEPKEQEKKFKKKKKSQDYFGVSRKALIPYKNL
jgi:hypothetical protein